MNIAHQITHQSEEVLHSHLQFVEEAHSPLKQMEMTGNHHNATNNIEVYSSHTIATTFAYVLVHCTYIL